MSVVAQQASERTEDERADSWIVGALAASQLIEKGEVVVLDTRPVAAFRRGHVAGSQHVDWRDFSQKEPALRGKLLGKKPLEAQIRKLGIDRDRPVLVLGEARAWGEDGRIVWMLRYAGHPRVALVDGGFAALKKTGVKLETKSVGAKPSKFEVRFSPELAATADQVAKAPSVIDVRTKDEFAGATPYGEKRGGHVPGAKSIHFHEWMNADGTIKPKAEVVATLKQQGVEPTSDIVLYCSGGVRSAWALVALQHYGFSNVRNYAGSMWEWASAKPEERPLVSGETR